MDNTTTNTGSDNGTAGVICQADMAQRVNARMALPLLPEGVPGPVQLAERWWAVPADQQDYRPVIDPDQIALLNRSVQRLTRARAAAGLAVGDR